MGQLDRRARRVSSPGNSKKTEMRRRPRKIAIYHLTISSDLQLWYRTPMKDCGIEGPVGTKEKQTKERRKLRYV